MHKHATPSLPVADLVLHQRWARMRAAVYVPLDLAWAAATVLLWRAGQPGWRVAALAAVVVAHVAAQAWELARSRRGAEAFDGRVFLDRAGFALSVAGVAASGGLRSPLLVLLLASLPSGLVYYGWSARTKARTGWLLGAGLAMAVVPAEWLGPEIPGRTAVVLAAVALVAVVFVITHAVGMLLGAAHVSAIDAFRARDELASHALARAKDLEHIGAQLSHELKNPLGAIKALVQLSVRAADEVNRERLEVIQSEVQRMQQILQDYLSFSRPLEKLSPHALSLGPLADEVLAILEARAAEARVALRRRGDARVEADARRLKEALINLVANSIEASPPGGAVEVEIARRDGAATIAVRDSGRGMAPEVLAKIGTPFFTTRESGTGLGVALARATFAQHGGALEYASAPGEGTTATATLPVRPAAPAPAATATATATDDRSDDASRAARG